jgi:cytoskeletal protein CcmA (bactofilin family)
MRHIVMALALLGTWPLTAAADPITDFGVFGNKGVSFPGAVNVSGGLIGSNKDVLVGTFSHLNGATGGGSFLNGPLGGVTINGPVTFNNNVTIHFSSSVSGPINAGGTVFLGGNGSTYGPVTAKGSVTGEFPVTINGNVLTGGNFTIGPFGKVNGNVTANGTVTLNGSQVTGVVTANAMTTVTPLSFSPVAVPGADKFSAGGQDIVLSTFQNIALAPGSYGKLSLGGTNNVQLRSGDYFFTSIESRTPFNFGNSLSLDLSNGPINIFVTGNIDLGTGTGGNIFVNGLPAFMGLGQPNPAVNQALAGDVFLETLGNFTGNGVFFGTIFTPNGDINPTGLTVIGSLLAGGFVADIDPRFADVQTLTVYSVPANRFISQQEPIVPEPSTFALGCLIALGLSCVHLRRGERSLQSPERERRVSLARRSRSGL